jgi:hypothetical protein
MQRVGYLNLKLVKGVSLKTGESLATPDQVGPELAKMVDLCPWAACAVPAAFNRFRGEWTSDRFRPNWSVPVHLGGFGYLPKVRNICKITREQRRMATVFLKDPRYALYKHLGSSAPKSILSGNGPLRKLCGSFTMLPGGWQGPLPSGAGYDSNDWIGRISYIARLAGDRPCSDMKAFGRHVLRRVKPASLETMEMYSTVKFVSYVLPECPPLAPLHYGVLPFISSEDVIYSMSDLHIALLGYDIRRGMDV